MKILLLSNNRTVQNMVALALDHIEDIELFVADSMDDIHEKDYDWMIVNDTFPLYQESLAIAKSLGDPATMVLNQPGNINVENFNHSVSKPFLPDELTEIILSSKPSKKKKKNKKNKKEDKSSEILNIDEIETIKALLEEDGLEIVHEEELAQTVLSEGSVDYKESKTKKEKSKSNKKTKKIDRKLLKAIKQMKPKKIRKLLKGAEVTLHISFPKER